MGGVGKRKGGKVEEREKMDGREKKGKKKEGGREE